MLMLTDPRRRLAAIAFALGLAAAVAPAASAQTYDIGWPRELDTDSAKIVIYQPQPESLNGISLSARSAVAVITQGRDDARVRGRLVQRARADRPRLAHRADRPGGGGECPLPGDHDREGDAVPHAW